MAREKKLFQLLPMLSAESPAYTLREPVGLSNLPYPYDTFNRIVGVEFEIEDCLWPSTDTLSPMFAFERDSSLRGDSAYELKTKFPRRLWQALEASKALYEYIHMVRRNYAEKAFDFSERTSTHVHVDVRDLTIAQLRSLVRLYMVFEKPFFEFIGRERQDNIFCIPLSQATILNDTVNIESIVFGGHEMWEKYCALNLACVNHFGSVEFRGMGGQEEESVVLKWMIMCASLVEFCKQNSEEDVLKMVSRLKYESQYEEFAKRVFGDYASELAFFPGHMDSAATFCKFIR